MWRSVLDVVTDREANPSKTCRTSFPFFLLFAAKTLPFLRQTLLARRLQDTTLLVLLRSTARVPLPPFSTETFKDKNTLGEVYEVGRVESVVLNLGPGEEPKSISASFAYLYVIVCYSNRDNGGTEHFWFSYGMEVLW